MRERNRVLKFVGLALLSLAAACSKPTADDHLKKATEYLNQSKLPEAIVEYRLALQVNPQRGDIRRKLGDAYMSTRDGAKALKEYVVAADLMPKDVGAQLQAGEILLRASQFDDAKVRATKVLAIDPKNAEALILLGNARAGLKDMDGALAEYQEAVALDPAQGSAYINIGTIQLVRGQADEAEATFRKAVEVAPKATGPRMALANFLWAAKRQPEAEQVLKDTLALDPSNLDVNRALGLFYVAANRAAEAEPYFKLIAAKAKTTAATIGLADYYVILHRLDDARDILKELAKKDDAFAVATTRLAAVDATAGNRAHALTELETVLTKYPEDVSARLLRARLLLIDGRRDEAMADATAITTKAPNSAAATDAYLLIGHIQAGLDRTDEAIKAYEEVLHRQSRAIAADLALAAIYLQMHDLNKAATHVQSARTIEPTNPQARALQIRVLLLQHSAVRAKQELASLRADFPNSPTVLDLVAAQQLSDGQTEAARASYAKAADMAPSDREALAGLVTLDLAAGHTKAAVDRVDAAMKRVEPTGSFLMLAAETYRAAGDQAKAEELLKRAIDAEPQRLKAYSLLGELYVRQNRLGDAQTQFQKIVERNPKSTSANTMLGMLYEVQGKTPEAEHQYEQTLAVDSRAAVASNNLAWLYVADGRNLDKALMLAQTALQQMPDEPHVNDTLGWIYFRKKMPAAAIKYLESSVQKDPGDPSTHYHLGMAYVETGEPVKAKQELQRALGFKRDFDGADEARKALAQIGASK